MIKDTVEYQLIKAHYADRTTKRTGVPLINHIDEGLIVLDAISATETAKRAFCIHPLLQKDSDLNQNYLMVTENVNSSVVMLAMEYRNIANRWLSDKARSPSSPVLSPLYEVNDMLIADKVQNRKEFLRYHLVTHERAGDLAIYFTRWLGALGITSEAYNSLCKRIEDERANHGSL